MKPANPPEPTWAPFRRAPRWGQAALGLNLGFIGWLLTAPERTRAMRLFSIGFLAAVNFAVAWAFRLAARRESLPRAVQQSLRLVAAGNAVVGLGAAYLFFEVVRAKNYTSTFSVADALFLLSYPLIMLGMARLPRGDRPAAGRGRIALDGAACVVGVGVPLWLGAVGPAFRDATGPDALLVVLWPGVAFVGLVAVNTALLTRAPVPTRGALWLLLASLGASWLADLIFALDASALVVRHSAIHWSNLVNAVSSCLSLLAAWRFSSDPLPAQPRLRPAAFSPVPMATMIIVAAWLIILSLVTPADPQMLRRILPGLILLFFVLLIREVLVLIDTGRWMAAEQARESHARVEAMVRHSSDVLMVVDAPGTIQFASPSLTAVLGLPVDRLVGEPLVRLVHPDDEAPGRLFLDGLTQAPAAVAGVHWRLRHADGTYREFETAGSNALGEPAVAGLVLNSRDVTERRLLEAELRQSHKLEAIGRLVGGIAHNFNNLLASTFLRLDFIRRDRQLPPELEQEIVALEAGAKRTAALILQLQSIGQVRMLRRKQVELGAMLAELRPELERLVGGPIELVLVDAARPEWIEADSTLINQVILNLCANARDAMPHGGRLTITITRGEPPADAAGPGLPGDYVCLSFQDTGRGIDEPTRQRLFEPFFTTKDVGLGLGLGLAAAQGIVQQHHGRLVVDSAVGRGTTFRILLPVAPDTNAAPAPEAAPAAVRPPPGRKLHHRLTPRTAATESGR